MEKKPKEKKILDTLLSDDNYLAFAGKLFHKKAKEHKDVESAGENTPPPENTTNKTGTTTKTPPSEITIPKSPENTTNKTGTTTQSPSEVAAQRTERRIKPTPDTKPAEEPITVDGFPGKEEVIEELQETIKHIKSNEDDVKKQVEKQFLEFNKAINLISARLGNLEVELKQSKIEREKLLIEEQIKELQAQLNNLTQGSGVTLTPSGNITPASQELIVTGDEKSIAPPSDAIQEFNEVDYAVLKAVSYGIVTIKELSRRLQIKTLIIEEHVDKLISRGYLKFFKYLILTKNGKEAIVAYETTEPEDVWNPIDEFIISVKEADESRREYTQQLIDKLLLVAVALLLLLIIYFGFF